jgi:tRNA (mo5U34)-methyltransferase
MDSQGCFDVVFCLGVLYHVTDPINMLRTLWKSMAKGATLIVDCQGIPDELGPTEGGAEVGSSGGGGGNGESGGESGGASGPARGAGGLPLCLVPRGKYAGGSGMWFLPNRQALVHWLERANFRDVTVFYAAPLSADEQRATPDWAHLKSLSDNLDPNDPTKTVEGYPAPWRYYVRATRG